jgi:putative hemolysin
VEVNETYVRQLPLDRFGGGVGSYSCDSTHCDYTLRLATTEKDVRAAQRLRFLVFNVELGEGYEHSYHIGRDEDIYDTVCDHLLVEWKEEVIGTYRMLCNSSRSQPYGYYSEQEFDFSPFELMRGEIVELGRACVARQHRNGAVLALLWRGIGVYARMHRRRYLIGCTSLTSQDEAEGVALHSLLVEKHLAPVPWRTKPKPAFACALQSRSIPPPRPPKLLSAYLALGARICAPPAIDRDFKTIDFLTHLDLCNVPVSARRFFPMSYSSNERNRTTLKT